MRQILPPADEAWEARRPPRLDLDIYPYLPRARVETTKPASYMSLMRGAGA